MEVLMPRFSRRSLSKLNTCDVRIISVMQEVVKHFDCTILEGSRTEERQKELIAEGKSKTMKSKHLRSPSLAIDCVPYPIDWEDRERITYFAGYVMGIAKAKGIDLRWGGDWDQDTEVKDNGFDDLVHFELV